MGSGPDAALADVLVHEHHVTHVVAAAGDGVETPVDSRPPLLVALVGAIEEEIGDLATGDPFDDDL